MFRCKLYYIKKYVIKVTIIVLVFESFVPAFEILSPVYCPVFQSIYIYLAFFTKDVWPD